MVPTRNTIITKLTSFSVPVLAKCSSSTLKKIVDVIDEVSYNNGEYIIREGELGDAFYIIKSGTVILKFKFLTIVG